MNPGIFGESVNIGTGIKTTLAELVETTIKNFNLEITPTWGSMKNRNWDIGVSVTLLIGWSTVQVCFYITSFT